MSSLRAWSSARFTIPLPAGHRFPIDKYSRVRDQVIRQGLLPPGAIAEPEAASVHDLALAHTPGYVAQILDGRLPAAAARRLGFPWSPELRERARRSVQGTVEAARDALETGCGIHLAGGTHHAFADRGEGFCVFNDVAVAIRVLRETRAQLRIAIVDLDVHQGNGTAHMFQNDESVYTFSMHGDKNYPFHKERSRLDLPLPDGLGDQRYLDHLDRQLPAVLEASRAHLVFYLAGADPYREDRFGRLDLSAEGLRLRDRMVFANCRTRGLPVVMTLAGGYAADLEALARLHAATVAELLVSHGH